VARKGGVRKTYTVRLISAAPVTEATPASQPDQPNDSAGGEPDVTGVMVKPLGLTVTPLTAQVASQLGAPAGTRGLLIQSIDQEGASAEVRLFGMDSGSPDVILSSREPRCTPKASCARRSVARAGGS